MNGFYYFLLICMVNIVPGCSTYYKSESGTIKDFNEYAREVFIRQNQALDEVMYLSETELDTAVYEVLVKAEQELQNACELLNEYAVREMEGQSMSFFFQNQVKNSVSVCAQSIQNVEDLLKELVSDSKIMQNGSPSR